MWNSLFRTVLNKTITCNFHDPSYFVSIINILHILQEVCKLEHNCIHTYAHTFIYVKWDLTVITIHLVKLLLETAQLTTVHNLEEIRLRQSVTNPIYEELCLGPKRGKTISSPSTSETYLEIKGWRVNIQSLMSHGTQRKTVKQQTGSFCSNLKCKTPPQKNSFIMIKKINFQFNTEADVFVLLDHLYYFDHI